MENKKDLGVIGSSMDSAKISATIQGLILAFGGYIISFLAHYGILFQGDVTTLASNASLAIGLAWTLFGLIRKIVMMFAK